MIPVDGDFIRRIAPRFSGSKEAAQTRIIDAISGVFASTLDAYEINTFLRIAHFMGQVTHECAGFRTTEEFASGDAYEGRKDLGNTEPGDGRRYKGRGLIQLTGRHNYRRMGETLRFDLERNPELAGEPLTSLHIACVYWKDRNINRPADGDDLISVTRLVNGGLNGLEDRRVYLGRAKEAMRAVQGLGIALEQGGASPVLRRGSAGEAVAEAQMLLQRKGFQLAIDGHFGPATEAAVMAFQAREGLAADGIIGRETRRRLEEQQERRAAE